MGINFPNSPLQGALYTPPGGYQYVYLDGVWRVVEAPQSVGTAQARSRIVNGAMQVSQENSSATSATNSVTSAWFNADQWSSSWSLSPGTAGAGRASVAPFLPDNSNYLTLGIGTAKAALAAADNLHIGTQIEGIRMRDFLWGTAAAKQAMLVFSIYSNVTGTYTVAIRNGAADRSFLAPFAYTTAGAWQQFSIVVPGDTAGTWAVDNSRGAYINFCFAMGSSFNGVAGWQGGSLLQLAGSSNLAAGAGNGLRLGNVGLYLDPNATGVPPPWQMPDEAQELAACQRYYSKFTLSGVGLNFNGYAAGVYMKFLFPTQMNMRTLPALATVIPGMTLGAGAQNVGAALTLNNLGWLFSVSGATSNANVSFVAGDYYAVNARM